MCRSSLLLPQPRILLYRSRSLITNVISCMLRLSLANDVAAMLSLVSLSVYSPHYFSGLFKRYKAAAPAAAYPVRFLCSFILLSPILSCCIPQEALFASPRVKLSHRTSKHKSSRRPESPQHYYLLLLLLRPP